MQLNSVSANLIMRTISGVLVIAAAMLQYVVNSGADLGLTHAQTSLASLIAVGVAASISLLPRVQGDEMSHVRAQMDADARLTKEYRQEGRLPKDRERRVPEPPADVNPVVVHRPPTPRAHPPAEPS